MYAVTDSFRAEGFCQEAQFIARDDGKLFMLYFYSIACL